MLKKTIRIVSWFLVIVLLLALGAGAAVWLRGEQIRKSGEKVKLLHAPELPGKGEKIPLGEKIPFKAVFSVPWGTSPLALSAESSPGSQLAEEPLFTKIKTGWGRDLWQGLIVIQPYRAVAVAAAKAQASFSGGQVLEFAIPAFTTFAPAVQGSEPELAGAIDFKKKSILSSGNEVQKTFLILAILGVLGILVLAAVWYFLQKKEKIIPTWEKALLALQDLLEKVKDGQIAPERSITKLCDILREYLEKRFDLRASRQTTSEFLSALEQDQDSILNGEQRLFLQEFLCTADMVKFAKQEASPEQIRLLASRGEALIRETIPGQDPAKSKENKK